MSSEEFTEWMAYDTLQPWGDRRGDIQSGIVAATVFNMMRSSDTPARSTEDFMPRFGVVARAEDLAERIIGALTAASQMGGEG